MLRPANRPLRERALSASLAAALHGGLILALLSLSSESPAPVLQPTSIALISLGKPQQPQSRPPPPVLPSKVAHEAIVLAPPSTATESQPGDAAAQVGCSTLDQIGKLLNADPAAVAAVLAAPPESRSIADAVIVWNAGWSEIARDPAAPLGPARALLERSLEAVPEDCLAEEVIGPRLVPVEAGEDRMMFVVIGSGTWRWSDLLLDPLPPATVAPARLPNSDRTWFGLAKGP